MINLCDDDKYYTDSSLSSPAKRSARKVEDIEIVGNIFSDESIDFPSLSGICGISSIASITCTFFSPTSNLEIIGLIPDDPSNPRMPTGTKLTEIETKNPLRFEHGWYSINPSFTIGSVITNGNVKVSNIGYNNSRTDCNNFIANNSIIANNAFSVNSITFTNNSKAYSSNFNSNSLNLLDTKIDQSNIISLTGTYSYGSYLECQILNEKLRSSGTTFIDCEITVTDSDFVSNSIYRSSIIFNTSTNKTTGIIPAIILNECTMSGAIINSDILYLKGGSSKESSISSNDLYAGESTFTLLDGTLTASKVYNADIYNSGTISFGDVHSIKLVNQTKASMEVFLNDPVSTVTNNPSGVISVGTAATFLNGINHGYIIGELVRINNTFVNSISGKINTKNCLLYNSVNNLGEITTANLYNTSQNNGHIINGKFYDNSKNLQIVNVAEFYHDSINDSTGLLSQATFNDRSINNANLSGISITFNDNAINKGIIYGASFFNSGSHTDTSCYNSVFNDYSFIGGDGISISGIILNNNATISAISTDVNNIIFNDNSSFNHIKISAENAKIEMLNLSSGSHIEILGASGIRISLNNNSYVNLIDGTYASGQSISINDTSKVDQCNGNIIVIFNNESLCGSSQANIKLYDSAKATGTNYDSILCYDRSQFAGASIGSGVFFDKSEILSSNISSSNFIEFNNSQNNKYIQGNTVYFTNGAKNLISGVIQGNTIKFYNSNNYGIINNTVVFSGSTNYSKNLNSLSYYVDSSNNGSGNNIFYFGNGSMNNGYAHTAYFYSGSINNGTVENGYFYTNITQTGTVLNSGIISNEFTTLNLPF